MAPTKPKTAAIDARPKNPTGRVDFCMAGVLIRLSLDGKTELSALARSSQLGLNAEELPARG